MIVAIASGKGGTGKTTLAVNLALSMGEPVQLLDCDVEAPNAHLFLRPQVSTSEPAGVLVPRVDPDRCSLCGECSEHFSGLQSILRGIDVDFILDPLLVRGLDYYTKTAYEVLHPGLGGQNALCGGGRYDGLAEECGGGKIPAVGFSAGMERLMENLPEKFAGKIGLEPVEAFFILPEESASAEVLSIARALRSSGMRISVDLSGRAMKKQMKAASESGAPLAVIIGPEEIEKKMATVKVLASGGQESVPFDELAARILQERKNEVD